jgi:hypothetical protein
VPGAHRTGNAERVCEPQASRFAEAAGPNMSGLLWPHCMPEGAGPRSCAYVPVTFPGSLVLDVVNLTRWSFCFRRQTTLGGWASSLRKMTPSGIPPGSPL